MVHHTYTCMYKLHIGYTASPWKYVIGPWAVAAERSEDATKGPRLSKSRISIGRAV